MLAGPVAEQHHATKQEEKDMDQTHGLNKNVIERLVAIGLRIAEAKPSRPPAKPREPRPTLKALAKEATSRCTHSLQAAVPSWLCQCCLARAPAGGKPLLKWLRSGCDSTGLVRPHATHNCQLRSTVVWCVACGSWSSSRYRALALPCQLAPQTGLQRMALRRLAAGRPPTGLDHADLEPYTYEPTGELEITGGPG